MSSVSSVADHGVFITGTDTGVGKTFVGVRLIRALQAQGLRIAPRKPVESGCEPRAGAIIPADAKALFEAAGQRGGLDAVCRYRLAHALSPDRAGRLENVRFSIGDLAAACREGIVNGDFLLVEGAGGFYSPLAEDGLNADLAAALGLPVVIVAADRLGCINQVLLTAEAVKHRGLTLAAIALNRSAPDPLGGMDNAADLRPRLSCPVMRIGHDEDAWAGIAKLAALINVPVY